MSSVLRDPNLFSLDRSNRDEIALFLAKATLAAGPAVMEEYERGCSVASKQDGSPVTSADQRAEAEKLAALVDQSRRRSAVFDVITNGVPVSVNVAAA